MSSLIYKGSSINQSINPRTPLHSGLEHLASSYVIPHPKLLSRGEVLGLEDDHQDGHGGEYLFHVSARLSCSAEERCSDLKSAVRIVWSSSTLCREQAIINSKSGKTTKKITMLIFPISNNIVYQSN